MVREIVGDSSGRLGRPLGSPRAEATLRIQTPEAARFRHNVRLYHSNESRRDRRRPVWPRVPRTKGRLGNLARLMHNKRMKLTQIWPLMSIPRTADGDRIPDPSEQRRND